MDWCSCQCVNGACCKKVLKYSRKCISAFYLTSHTPIEALGSLGSSLLQHAD